MTAYVALLRAVNVGGTGRLPMTLLTEMCEAAGFTQVRTFIASGNVVFKCADNEDRVRTALEKRLHDHFKTRVGVVVRTAVDIADVLARNPFDGLPNNQVMVLFADTRLPTYPMEGASGDKHEQVRLGKRAMYIFYPEGMAKSRLRLPCAKYGTARNMNTVAKLAEMSTALI